MRFLGYTRVNEAGRDARPQLEALTAAGVQEHAVFCDVTAVGGEGADRPWLRRLLEDAKEGDIVVVWRIDRLGRSLGEVLDTVAMMGERGLRIRSLEDAIDPSNDTGQGLLDLLVRLGEYERHLASERIAAGMNAARKAGTTLGRPRDDPTAVADKVRVVEAARARGLSAAEAARLVGWSRPTFYRHRREHKPQP